MPGRVPGRVLEACLRGSWRPAWEGPGGLPGRVLEAYLESWRPVRGWSWRAREGAWKPVWEPGRGAGVPVLTHPPGCG